MNPELHDRVALLEERDEWPAGTAGTVVDALSADMVLVELVAPSGETLDLLDVPTAAVRVVERRPALA